MGVVKEHINPSLIAVQAISRCLSPVNFSISRVTAPHLCQGSKKTLAAAIRADNTSKDQIPSRRVLSFIGIKLVFGYHKRDDQWERIKDFLPGPDMSAALRQTTGCSLTRFFTDIEREFPGEICRCVSATGRSCTSALADGPRAAFSSEFSSLWQAIRTTNT